MAARTALVERDLQGAYGRVGLVRFNPFEGDTGGNQSFALALLGGRGDGFVVSSLHARAVTRMYAKAITAGSSEAATVDRGGGGSPRPWRSPPPGRVGRRAHPAPRVDGPARGGGRVSRAVTTVLHSPRMPPVRGPGPDDPDEDRRRIRPLEQIPVWHGFEPSTPAGPPGGRAVGIEDIAGLSQLLAG